MAKIDNPIEQIEHTEYSEKQRSSNRRQVFGVGVVLFGLLLVSAIFNDMSLAILVPVGLILGAFVAVLWWLFASKKAKPIMDPGQEGRRAAIWGGIMGIFIKGN